MTQKNESIYFLSLAYVVLSLIFVLMAIVSVPCIYRAFRAKSNQFFPKVFYIFILITCVEQASYQSVFLSQVMGAIISPDTTLIAEENFKNLFFQTIYVPDAIFFIVYFSLFWQFLIMMHHGRIQMGNIMVGKQNWDPIESNSKIRIILYLYTLAQIVIIWLYTYEKILSTNFIMICDIVVNASVPLIVLIIGCYLNVKFSGSPFVSGEYEKKKNKIQYLLQFWVFLRIPQLVVNVLAIVYDNVLYDLFNGTLNTSLFLQLVLAFLVIGDVIIVQIIPLFMAMSNDFLKAILTNNSNLLLGNSIETLEDLKHNQVNTSIKHKEKISFINLKYSEIQFVKSLFYKRLYGFGEIKMGSIGSDRIYAFRIIELKELSQFLIDETKQDLVNSQILWLEVRNSQIILMSKYYENGSLYTYITSKPQISTDSNNINIVHPKQNQFTSTDSQKQFIMKINLALSIAKKLEQLHKQNLIHGHLNLNNVMFTKSYNIKIIDFGLKALKKYCGLVNGYVNKTGFSAPECFKERGNVTIAISKQVDIYSFGMIIYSIFTEKIPFEDVHFKKLQQLVLEQQHRPKISNDLNEQIATLIRFCWQQDPEQRPTISQVIGTLGGARDSLISDQNV